jgi:hypothetical protein
MLCSGQFYEEVTSVKKFGALQVQQFTVDPDDKTFIIDLVDVTISTPKKRKNYNSEEESI